jgi:hypothetical protein
LTDTAVNGTFEKLLQEEADVYMKELETEERMPDFWALKDRRIMAIIVGWQRLS